MGLEGATDALSKDELRELIEQVHQRVLKERSRRKRAESKLAKVQESPNLTVEELQSGRS